VAALADIFTVKPRESARRLPRSSLGRKLRLMPPPAPTPVQSGRWKLYVVEAPRAGRVKIGISMDPERRRRDLQAASPESLTLVATMDGSYADEMVLHERFAEYREHGEWFRLEGALAEWIEGGCAV
jgi:hypothetical protein